MRPKIDPLPLLTTGQVAQLYGVHRDTVWGWIVAGITSRAGRRVKLHAVRVGGRWKTTQEWLDAFLKASEGETVEVAPSRRMEEARGREAQERLARKLKEKRR